MALVVAAEPVVLLLVPTVVLVAEAVSEAVPAAVHRRGRRRRHSFSSCRSCTQVAALLAENPVAALRGAVRGAQRAASLPVGGFNDAVGAGGAVGVVEAAPASSSLVPSSISSLFMAQCGERCTGCTLV